MTTAVRPTLAEALLVRAVSAAQAGRGSAGEGPRPSLDELRALPVVAVRAALDALLVEREVEDGLDVLQEAAFFDVWLPEVASLVGFGDGEWRHKDVWKHTKQVVRQSVPRREVRWGALLHDIGKPRTRRIEPNGEVHFFGHAEVGAAMFRKRIAARLAFEGELYDRVHFLILFHLRASQYDGSWTDSAVRRFAREMGGGLKDLLDLSRADITTKRPARRRHGLEMISELGRRIREIEKLDARVPPLPKGLGHAIMERFGLPPSKRIGELRQRLEDEVLAGNLEAHQPADYYLAWVAAHGAVTDGEGEP